jgi:hypothetical protein
VTKRIIMILSVAAIVLLIAAFLGFGPAFATHLRSCQSSTNTPYATGCISSASGAVVIGFVLYLAGALAALDPGTDSDGTAWALGLVRRGAAHQPAGFTALRPCWPHPAQSLRKPQRRVEQSRAHEASAAASGSSRATSSTHWFVTSSARRV